MSNNDIIDIYKVFKQIVLSIHQVNKRCNVFICPILPTKVSSINRKIFIFNDLIYKDLLQCNGSVSVVYGFGRFYNPDTCSLVENLASPDPSDTLHINENLGVPLLVRLIKEAIFYRKQRAKQGFIHSDRTYASTTRGGPARPV